MSEKKLTAPQVLISAEKLDTRLTELAAQIHQEYRGKEITALCILKGSFIFFSDLLRKLDLPVHCEFMAVSSYGDRRVSSGEVKVTLDIHEPIEGKHVLLIEDIVDSGLTLSYLIQNLKNRKPASIRTCSLLVKPESIKTDILIDYTGFQVGNEFVVGYGMDYAGKYRGLPYIGILEPEH